LKIIQNLSLKIKKGLLIFLTVNFSALKKEKKFRKKFAKINPLTKKKLLALIGKDDKRGRVNFNLKLILKLALKLTVEILNKFFLKANFILVKKNNVILFLKIGKKFRRLIK
jgi:hypothetical protein